MLTLNSLAKRTSAAKAVELIRDKELPTSHQTDATAYDVLSARLHGKRVYDEVDSDGTVTGSVHLFPDGSCYYDGSDSDGDVGTVEEFIESQIAMLEEQDDHGNFLFTGFDRKATAAALEQPRADARTAF